MGKDKDTIKTKSAVAQKTQSDDAEKSGIWQDERFQHLVSDPRFKSLHSSKRKVKIDKRFQTMFTDDKFAVKYTVDKYGRKVKKSNTDNLRKYYDLETSSESDADAKDEDDERRKEEQAISRAADGVDDVANDSSHNDVEPNDDLLAASDDEDTPQTLKEKLIDPSIDYARGEGRLVTDSSSDDESTDDDENDPEMYIDHVWGELDADAETTDESTRRLAVCNMDWDRIRAIDLMMLFNSFLPPGGSVLSVKIYRSEFGKERIIEEDRHGPPELVGLDKQKSKKKADAGSDSDSENELLEEQDSDAEEGDDYHMEKLRQYQMNRLRYYYAVVECDSVRTADKIYKECDGTEYESSATRVDLRFIPDDTTFDEDEPTDVCTELPDLGNYTPRLFTNTALQQAKVDLTWDETAIERRELGDKLSSGKLEAVSDRDIRAIVAYSSEEDENDAENEKNLSETENKAEAEENVVSKAKKGTKSKKGKKSKDNSIEKYKALLAEINDKEEKEKNRKFEMEFTWNVNDSMENNDDKDLGEDKAKELLTPIEKELLKRSEKNKKRKDERKKKKLQSKGIDPDDDNNDSDADSTPDDIDMNDPYFAEEFANGDFIDPQAKKKEKAKKQKKNLKALEDAEEERAKELELLLDDDDIEQQGKQHFSLSKIQKSEQETKSKRKRRQQLKKPKHAIANERKDIEDNFQVNVNDERFKALYTSHLYSIDPTNSHYKKTKAMEEIINEKLKRRHNSENGGVTQQEELDVKRPKKQLENTLLVNSLKRKLQKKALN